MRGLGLVDRQAASLLLRDFLDAMAGNKFLDNKAVINRYLKARE